MTEPMRWLEPGSDVPRDVRALLAAGPHAPPPLPREAREEGARFIAALPSAAVALKPWWARSPALTATLGATGAALVAVALARAPRELPTMLPRAHAPRVAPAPPAPVVAPAPRVVALPVTLPAPPAPPPTLAPAHHASASSHRSTASDALDERRLEAARVALDRDPTTTLSIVDALTGHGRRSAFAEEAAYLRVRALVRLHRDAEARRAGATFLRRHPSGIYSAAVRSQMERLP